MLFHIGNHAQKAYLEIPLEEVTNQKILAQE
jgi:hypothetical protein